MSAQVSESLTDRLTVEESEALLTDLAQRICSVCNEPCASFDLKKERICHRCYHREWARRRAALTPCPKCGKPKGLGRGKRLCDACNLEQKCSNCEAAIGPRRRAHGLCPSCYGKACTAGTIAIQSKEPVRERLMRQIEVTEDGCWIWQGFLHLGYGQINLNGRLRRVHRVSYEDFIGPIPEGLQLDHLCRNRACIKPTHLEPVTAKENSARSFSPAASNGRKTHCKRGHLLSDPNVYYDSSGGRSCRTCVLDRGRRRRAT